METFPVFYVPFVYMYSSYPTYEEWKQPIQEQKVEQKQGSYPTYEEWKPKNFFIILKPP